MIFLNLYNRYDMYVCQLPTLRARFLSIMGKVLAKDERLLSLVQALLKPTQGAFPLVLSDD